MAWLRFELSRLYPSGISMTGGLSRISWTVLRLKGWIAWWLWGIAHIYFLISVRSRVIVAIQWLWSYITFDRGSRLITGDDGDGTHREPH